MADMAVSCWPSLQAYVMSGWAARTSSHLQLCLGFCPTRRERERWPVTTECGQWPGRSRPVIALALTLPNGSRAPRRAEVSGLCFGRWKARGAVECPGIYGLSTGVLES